MEEPGGLQSMVGYNPWGRKESDTTKGVITLNLSEPCIFSKMEILERYIYIYKVLCKPLSVRCHH